MDEREKKISVAQLIIQVKDLPDDGIVLTGSVPFSELGLQSDDRFVLDGFELHYRLHVSPVKRDIYVKGVLSADIEAVCDRCAEVAPLHLSTDDVFHTYECENFEPVDISEEIREDAVMMFPNVFHCKPDCLGLCPMCGQNLNEGDCGCSAAGEDDTDEANPWSELSKLDLK